MTTGRIHKSQSLRRANLKRRYACLLAGAFYAILPPAALSAPIATNTALPLSEGEMIVREQVVVARSSDGSGGSRRKVERLEARTVLGYGLTSRLAVFGVLPFVNADTTFGNVQQSESGLGDAAIFARYEVFRADEPGRTFRIAPFVGARLPTGRDGKTGDGSTDIFGGVIVTWADTQWVLDSQLRYDANREADGLERGDVVSLDSSFQYRLAPGQITRDTKSFVFGVLELSATRGKRDRIGGATNSNSGGFQLFLTPGVQYVTRRWIADLGIKFPVISNLGGTALEPDYSVLTGIRVNF
jgi:Putative MetA-pathway of phenol degradation